MKKEIRDLRAGRYRSEDGDMLLDLFRDDDGVHIIHADLDLEWHNEWVISPDGKVKHQFVDSAPSNME